MPDMFMDVDAALAEVPVNLMPLIDDTDFKTRETAVAYNAAGMDLVWNFVTSAGAMTQTAVTPTTGGTYDWTHQGDGMYSIEIPASGGASINNDAEGYGWFTGFVTGVLPWRGPVIGFRAAALNDAMLDGGDLLDVSVTQWAGTAVATPTVAGVPEVDLTHVGGATTNVAALATNVDAILTDTGTTLQAELDGIQADTEDIQSRLPAALVSGRIDASVGAMAANTLTAAATAADYLAEINAEADTAIADAALATAANLATVAGYLDTEIAAILADTNELQTDWTNGGRLDLILDARASQTSVDDLPTNAELATALAGADDAVLTAIDALPTAVENADALLNRDMSAVSDTNARSPLNALRFIRNKWDVAAGILTVKKEDDSTDAWTASVSSDAAAEPVTGSDPT